MSGKLATFWWWNFNF